MYGIAMKKKYYTEVKRLSRYSTSQDHQDNEVILVPGLNIFRNGEFRTMSGNNLSTNLFAYKEHIYLNSDRYIDEGQEVFNEIQFTPNIKLFQLTGRIIPGHIHEEMTIQIPNNSWTLTKINLCKDLECLPSKSATPQFTLKYELNHSFLNYCQ
jgi:hypothetical protein